jgi:cystathionine gamma-synthase
MRDLLLNPLCDPGDLGAPIPDSSHATSVCLPRWQDNVAYEEGDPDVVNALRAGYPRFVFHPLTADLARTCADKFGAAHCLVFPVLSAARRCLQFIDDEPAAHIHEFDSVYAVAMSESQLLRAKQYWQHTGEGVSSRLAEAVSRQTRAAADDAVLTILRERIAGFTDTSPDDVYLYPSGMTAGFTAFRSVQRIFPNHKCVQFGFPYVDTLKVLEKFGAGAHFFSQAGDAELDRLTSLLDSGERIGAVFCEFPGNPTLQSPDLSRLRELADRFDFPLIVDDTIGTFANVRVLPPADILTSSLTKHFSGGGDVMGGSVVLNPHGRFYDRLKSWFETDDASFLYHDDAVCLEANSRDFAERMITFNANTAGLCDWLSGQPQIADIYYPKYLDDGYAAFRRSGGGFGSLFALIFEDPSRNAPRFYDALRVCKGPSLGTNFTLASPYTILAHYHELDFAEGCGVSRYLLRISAGLEELADLKGRFAAALDTLA